MSHDPFAPSPCFLAWLDSLPPTPRHAQELALQAKQAWDNAVQERAAAAKLEREQERERIRKLKEEAGEGLHSTRRGRRAKQEAEHPGVRVHLMEDDDKWRFNHGREQRTQDFDPAVE